MKSFKSLVIGYGNSLRSDDGIGVKVAEVIENWHLPKVRSLAIGQLAPELAAELTQVDLAIFVDACQSSDADTMQLYSLKPSDSIFFQSHYSDPRALLSLTQALFGKCPQAWLVIVPGVNFQLGDRLSAMAEKGVDQALTQIKSLLSADNLMSPKVCMKSE